MKETTGTKELVLAWKVLSRKNKKRAGILKELRIK